MTMRQLAKLANVSVSTVSKAFHDAEDISPQTRQLVFDIAKKYGCYGKFYKGKFHKQIFAIISPEIGSGFYATYIEQLQKIIEQHNGIALISTDHFNKNAQSELVEYYASFLQVDGIIVFHLEEPLKKGYDIPIVSLFSSANPTVDTVSINLETPIFEAVALLRSLGHEKIAFIGEKHTPGKTGVFRKAMGGIAPDAQCIIQSQLRFEKAGEDGVRQLLALNANYTAIICAYDNIAFGAIKQLKQCGYRVPEDFSVIGIDNISMSQHTETALTSIDTNPEEVCLIAWDILQKKLESKYYRSNQSITIGGRLILRETVGKARHL